MLYKLYWHSGVNLVKEDFLTIDRNKFIDTGTITT